MTDSEFREAIQNNFNTLTQICDTVIVERDKLREAAEKEDVYFKTTVDSYKIQIFTLTRQLSEAMEAIGKNWATIDEKEKIVCTFCEAWTWKKEDVRHKPNCIVLTAAKSKEKTE
jgi:hypothetical protein